WWEIAKRAVAEVKRDMVPLLAAGVAFFGFVALFPTMIAVILVYGLISDPQDISEQVQSLEGSLPPEALELVRTQMESLAQSNQQGLGIGLVASLAVALWSASAGMGHLIAAVNRAYDEAESRGFVGKRGLALLLTFG